MSSVLTVEVVVIGAGVAGLKTAHDLLNDPKSKLSSSQVIVLEAQDRIGGRIKTDCTSSKLGYSYDLGAAWFHDTLSNEVLKEAIEDNDISLFNVEEDTYYDDKDAQLYAPEHEGPLDVVGLKLNRVNEDLEKFIELYFVESLSIPDLSLQDVSERFFIQYDRLLTEDQKFYCRRIIRHYELWYGITWDKISGKYSIMDHNGRNLLNKKGYQFLIEKLQRGIPNDRILTNHAVKKIDRTNKVNGKKVAIETTNGQSIYCNYVVVTVPQSILQLKESDAHGIQWVPPLPPNVTSALESIHFGALGKVIFEFDNVWWDPNEDRFDILADETIGIVPFEHLKSLPVPFSYPAFIINFASIHKDNNPKGSSLCIFTQSPLTDYLESHKNEAWTYFKPMLAKLARSGQKVSDPINVITSDWTQNPYVRGSYSALYTNDDPSELIIQLSGEFDGCGILDKNIRFAGEHTISDGAGCVHGAFASGKREAAWIIENIHST
ncbi:amine oxidase [Scheffersomyces xylosifermentans]|uniref:amine oxidase n=1 Tax=Scheffersomyces xylosifermentans TaxID=1304137 RepID=UPI00315C76F8